MTNHNTHTLEMLAAHASGHEPDRVAAEALIASCADCRVIYEEQLHMRSVLSGAGTVPMTESEQIQLFTAIGAALPESVRSLDTTRPRPQPLNPVWGRLMAAAAALAVVIGVGATIASQEDSGNAATTLAADTAAAPEFAAGGATDGERATETTAAPATLAQLETAGELDELKAAALALADEDAASVATGLCVEETEDLTISERGESTYQGREVLLLLVDDNGERSPRAFYLDDCTEIALPG